MFKKSYYLLVTLALLLSSCVSFQSTKEVFATKDLLGTISVSKTYIAPFFITKPSEEITKQLLNMLLAKAESTYGPQVTLANISITSAWSPYSLFFYFSTLGYVEVVTAEADVVPKFAAGIRVDSIDYIKLLHPELTDRELTAILHHSVFIGMRESAVIYALGNPEKINTSVGSWGVHKQYCYTDNLYIYIENGYVTSWSE